MATHLLYYHAGTHPNRALVEELQDNGVYCVHFRESDMFQDELNFQRRGLQYSHKMTQKRRIPTTPFILLDVQPEIAHEMERATGAGRTIIRDSQPIDPFYFFCCHHYSKEEMGYYPHDQEIRYPPKDLAAQILCEINQVKNSESYKRIKAQSF